MITKIFVEHPRSVGESYGQHCVRANSFGLKMIIAGIACCIHGIIPACFKNTGSHTIKKLHCNMITHRTSVHNDM